MKNEFQNVLPLKPSIYFGATSFSCQYGNLIKSLKDLFANITILPQYKEREIEQDKRNLNLQLFHIVIHLQYFNITIIVAITKGRLTSQKL